MHLSCFLSSTTCKSKISLLGAPLRTLSRFTNERKKEEYVGDILEHVIGEGLFLQAKIAAESAGLTAWGYVSYFVCCLFRVSFPRFCLL